MSASINNKQIYSASKLFKLRKEYMTSVVPRRRYKNFYDSSLVYYYGKVNLNGDIVYLSEKYLSILSNSNQRSGQTLYALNFVAQAFKDFRDYYIKGISAGLVKGDNPVNIIEPVKGWESVHELYANNINGLYSSLINRYLQSPSEDYGVDNSYPNNFDEFIRSVNNLFHIKGKNAKISRSSFILSPQCPLSISGLAIEISPKISYSNDKEKNNDFYENRNFKFYMHALKKFGFMVDVDYPGRIVADIGSPAMQKYMAKFGLTMDNLFDKYYYKAGEYDYDLVRIYLLQFYNNYVKDYPSRTIISKQGSVKRSKYSMNTQNFKTNNHPIPTPIIDITCEKTTKKTVVKMRLTQGDLEEKYNDEYWITQCIKILNYELNNIYDDSKLNKIIKNAQDLNKNIDIDTARSYINNVFKILRYPSTMKSLSNYIEDSQNRIVDVLEQSSLPTSVGATSTSGGSSGGSTSGGGSGGGGY